MNPDELRGELNKKESDELVRLSGHFGEPTLPQTPLSFDQIVNRYVNNFRLHPEWDIRISSIFGYPTEDSRLKESAIYGTVAHREAAKSAELSAKYAKDSNEHASGANRIAAAANALSRKSNTIAVVSCVLSVFALVVAIIACVIAFLDYQRQAAPETVKTLPPRPAIESPKD